MITLHGKPITDEEMQIIASYMDDETRERLHSKLAPCTHDEFLLAYLETPDGDALREILEREFDMVINARYTVFWIGGERDGETLFEYNDLDDAIASTNEFYTEHETEFDPVCGGVGICDNEQPEAWIEW